jgi:hypothetical protein
MASLLVHPFAGSVTVNVYVPAAFTNGVAVVAPLTMNPPLLATHENRAPAVVLLPSSVTLVVLHVNTLSLPAFAFGAVVFEVTVIVADELHPVLWLVTVTV